MGASVDSRLLGIAAILLTCLGGYLLVDLREAQADVRNLTNRVALLEQSSTNVAELTKEVRYLRESLIAAKVIKP